MQGKNWTKKEINKLKRLYPITTNKELVKIFNRTKHGIYKKAYRLNLKKTPEIYHKDRSEAMSGKSSGNWNGGRRTTSNGYVAVLDPEHPRAWKSGYVLEHIKVMSDHIGRLVRPPELRYTTQGTALTKFTLAVDGYKDSTNFIPIQCWGKLAEAVANYQDKGKQVGITGELQSRQYEKDGQKRTYYVVNASEVKFLDRVDDYQSNNKSNNKTDYQGYEAPQDYDEQDDLPF